MPGPCVFCAILEGRVPAFRVSETPDLLAFLDTRPVFFGHTLVVPKVHHETLLDLPEGLVGPLFQHVQRLAGAMEAALGVDGTFVAVNNKVSQSVPHLHVHVVPRKKKDGLRGFFWPRLKYETDEHAKSFASRVRSALR